jgi:hypothetical protein
MIKGLPAERPYDVTKVASMVVNQLVAGRLSGPRTYRIQMPMPLFQLPNTVSSRGFMTAYGAKPRPRMEGRTLPVNVRGLYHSTS